MNADERIKREQAEFAESRQHMACEAFGYGTLPQLQSAVYKVPTAFFNNNFPLLKQLCWDMRGKNPSLFVFPQLETKFKDNANKTMTERDEPFKCFVKFSSPNILESFRHCASSGMNSF